ncbi:MAG: DUF3883 domain-containing protein [Candidatus Obscuribacter sp.]|nr:DUF3883 domain-containing protein [Candidatus Obscuribacter sp.]MBK9278551.1 DUF3883 domain-containing protein [Candidatus Obscuribacter sp.]
MRLIKCSKTDEEFTSEAEAVRFFRQTLWEKGGRFGFGYGNQIGPTSEALSEGETVLFQYDGKIRFFAKTISGRLDGPEGEHFFLVDLDSLCEIEEPISNRELEQRLRQDAGLECTLGGQAWTKIPSNDLTEAVVRSLEVKRVENPHATSWKKHLPKEAETFVQATDVIAGKSEGPAFQRDILKRRAIEEYAMSLAFEYYQERFGTGSGTVTDVSKFSPFDLLCVDSDGCETRVEVKGTTGKGEQVILTRNEVENARNYPAVDLFIVCNILLVEEDGVYKPTGGDVRVARRWSPSDDNLEALSYCYRVPEDIIL